jgi:hypothetical protein
MAAWAATTRPRADGPCTCSLRQRPTLTATGFPTRATTARASANANQANADGDGFGDACDGNSYAPQAGTVDSTNATGNEGDTLGASGNFTDGDGYGALTISKQNGDGSVLQGANGAWSWSLSTTDNGTGSVTVQASDGEHAVATETFDWSALNVAPTGTFNIPSTNVNEGSSFNLSITDVTDPSSVDTTAGFTYAFDCGTGGYGSFGASNSATCTTAVDGPATLNVAGKVKDKDGGVSEYPGSVTVDNVAPTINTLVAGSAASCGSAISLTINFSDSAGVNDTYSASINWGDGNTSTPTGISSGYVASHTYATAGQHTATVTVSDEDGGTSSSVQKTLTVNYNTSGVLQPINDTRNGQPVSLFKYKSTIPAKVQVQDCDGSYPSNLTLTSTCG